MDFKQIVELTKNHPFYQKTPYNNRAIFFEEYPILTKIDARQISSLSTGDIVNRTSGSSGGFLNVFWHYQDYLHSLSNLWKKRRAYGVSSQDNYCANHAVLYNRLLNPLNHKVVHYRNCLSFSKLALNEESLAQYVAEINNFRPTFLLFQPSFAYVLGTYLEATNQRLCSSVKLLELTGEYFNSEIYLKLQSFYPQCHIANMYGMQEFNGIAYGTADFMEILHDNVFVEILSENSDGIGDIVVTTKTNSAMPLIRYKTGDKGCFVEKDGKTGLRIANSRSNDTLSISNTRYDGSVFLLITEKINEEMGNAIFNFQYMLQNGVLFCNYVLKKGVNGLETFNQAVEKEVLEFFGDVFKNIVVSVNEKNLFFDESIKIKYFINKDQNEKCY